MKRSLSDQSNLTAEPLAGFDEREAPGEGAWMAELERRAECFRRGEVQGIPWDDVRTGIQAHLRRG